MYVKISKTCNLPITKIEIVRNFVWKIRVFFFWELSMISRKKVAHQREQKQFLELCLYLNLSDDFKITNHLSWVDLSSKNVILKIFLKKPSNIEQNSFLVQKILLVQNFASEAIKYICKLIRTLVNSHFCWHAS